MAHRQSRRPHDRTAAPPRVAIGLIAKTPVAGAVKTRLCPPLSPEQAAALAAAMLADSADNARASGHDVWCVHAGAPDGLPALLPAGTPLLAQRGAGLAEALAAAQRDLHALGYDRVVLLGADCPTVEPAYLRAAATALRTSQLVLGPASDGGYNLIGTRRAHASLFAVEMSTPRVLTDTLVRARALRLSSRCLPPRRDLDTVEDLRCALQAGELSHAPRTATLVRQLRSCPPQRLTPRPAGQRRALR